MIDFRRSQIHYSRFVPNSLSIQESQGNEKKFWKALKKTLPYTLLYFSDMFLVSYDVTSFFSSIFLSETIDLAVILDLSIISVNLPFLESGTLDYIKLCCR